MAKKKVETGTNITTPSPYGSHSSMVVEEISPTEVKCKDDLGEYVTLKCRIDNGMADPNRWGRRAP